MLLLTHLIMWQRDVAFGTFNSVSEGRCFWHILECDRGSVSEGRCSWHILKGLNGCDRGTLLLTHSKRCQCIRGKAPLMHVKYVDVLEG